MKLYVEVIKLLFSKFILRKKTGEVLKVFCERMGVVYIKLAQILATQNFGNLFTEEDRRLISSICDDVNPVCFEEIKSVIEEEYGERYDSIFKSIDENPVGAASISQVHKATLVDGTLVAVKVKRKDITNTMLNDINRIKRLVHRYGRLFNFKNLLGSDKALELYLSWILKEIDFSQERENIKVYHEFSSSVNGKVLGCKKIVLPKVYEDLCTLNIIVMEFIPYKTINKLVLSDDNKSLIIDAINSYLSPKFLCIVS